MTTIHWTNRKIYDHVKIDAIMKYVEGNMNGLLPLYGNEKKRLMKYASDNNIPDHEIISIRNTIKIQKEINNSKKYSRFVKIIKQRFIDLVKNINPTLNSTDGLEYANNSKIISFYKSLRLPFNMINNVIKKMPEFELLSDDNKRTIKKIEKLIHLNEVDILNRSMQFEKILEQYLTSHNISYRTEADIKRDKDYTVTPDILFDEPITINLDGTDYKIRWMDAKNYLLTNTPFILKSLKKQAQKYNSIFGMGAFVFHYGIDSSVTVPNSDVLLLDGSRLH